MIESLVVTHLLGWERGICRGHEQLRKLFQEVARRKPQVPRYHRNGYLTDGHTVIWEYPREAPDGDQMEFVEVMEIENGLIRKHHVYWGWFGGNVLMKDQYHASPR